MNAFDRVCRAAGIFLLGSGLVWMIAFAIMFFTEIGTHQRAHIPWAHNQGGWIIFPILVSVITLILAIVSSVEFQ